MIIILPYLMSLSSTDKHPHKIHIQSEPVSYNEHASNILKLELNYTCAILTCHVSRNSKGNFIDEETI